MVSHNALAISVTEVLCLAGISNNVISYTLNCYFIYLVRYKLKIALGLFENALSFFMILSYGIYYNL